MAREVCLGLQAEYLHQAINGAGLKKCNPITRCDFSQPRANAVTEREEVFVGKMASSFTMPSSAWKSVV